jgi:tRNA-uridine 2-sulfurtransferase
MTRTVVGMSGGVDSSLAAALIREAGHEVVGVTMQLWPCADQDGGFTREDACCSPTETIDARSVAVGLGVRHYVVDFVERFRTDVVDGFTSAYAKGETPNPCVRCNEKIKFGALWDYARGIGADRVATGHYARAVEFSDRWLLRKSVDVAKDQTYFLFSLTQEQLAHAEFPVGHLTKQQVREKARDRKLATADKHESQDICFIGRDGVDGFLRRERPDAFHAGPIVHEDGTKLGEHRGLGAYTVGQRKGLGVAWSEPLFVTHLDISANTVVLGPRTSLLTTEALLRDCTWHLGDLPSTGLACLVRPRYRGQPVRATIRPNDGGGAVVCYAEAQPRVNAGQACVAYDLADEHCLGGGWFIQPPQQ